MIRLIRTEILRLRSRRLLKIAAAAVLLLITVIVLIDGINSSKSNSAEYARYKTERLAQYDAFVAANPQPSGQDFQPSRDEVEANPENHCFPAPGAGEPGQDQFVDCGGAPKKPYLTAEKLPDFGIVVAVICAFAAFLIGASAAGAEWSAGTMQSLLFWEPRRVRVVLAKVIGLAAVTGLLVVVAEALFTGLAFGAGELRGSTGGLSGGDLMSHVLLVARAVAFAGFAAVLGFSIAFGTRVTAAAVGIAFIYFAILEQLLVGWKIWLGQYAIGPLLASWLNNGLNIGISGNNELNLTGVRSGLTLAIYAVIMLTAATVWFRQRDVT